ncbi:TPA: hypothetical protein ACFRGQ_000387 [Neisseria lactamica]|uniref:hypothetical protein n=1 Tax=Neisseria lactamica TaxID=486 RepID=UPI001864B124|nr:hypothetical protein [Neisseria lactamica]
MPSESPSDGICFPKRTIYRKPAPIRFIVPATQKSHYFCLIYSIIPTQGSRFRVSLKFNKS